ncbi:MAG TPA: DUF4129 domain-containing protein [Anaerolineales bacterium]|nr:DUF4129 domain-containing protein [Anaerolineales bacterium]
MKQRRWALGVCAIVLVTTVLLAPSLDHLSFEPAKSFARAPSATGPTLLPGLGMRPDIPVPDILFIWLLFVVNLLLLVLLLPPEWRRRLIRQVTRVVLGLAAILLALRYRLLQWPESWMDGVQPGHSGMLANEPTGQPDIFFPPRLDPWWGFIISLILFWLVGLVVLISYRAWRRYRIRRAYSLSVVSEIARGSLEELKAGRDWGDVVIQAYARMNEAVRVSKGLQRHPSATPRDFAARLARTGLPTSAIEELTYLFESVRYGGEPAEPGARRRAAACLESILHACRGPA